jgi:cytochrome o ubiquinol oxidase subunit 2
MRFKVNATSQQDFDSWVSWARQGQDYLGSESYAELAKPSQNNWPATYTPVQQDLYATILSKYMLHTNIHVHDEDTHNDEGAH